MAITTIGFDGTVTESEFAKLMRTMALSSGSPEFVQTGFTVSPGTGRAVNVSTGTGLATSVRYVSDAVVSVALNANATSGPRVDAVIAEANWSTNLVTVKAVAGTGATRPSLTQTEGTLWQTALGWVTVPVGATTILASNIVPGKPLSRVMRVFRGTVNGTVPLANGAWITVSSVNYADPGWAYRLAFTCQLRFESTPSGSAWLRVVNSAGDQVGPTAFSARLSNGGRVPAHLAGTSDAVTGAGALSLQVYGAEMTTGDTPDLMAASAMNDFTVRQIPA